jgi:hypothetical protein
MFQLYTIFRLGCVAIVQRGRESLPNVRRLRCIRLSDLVDYSVHESEGVQAMGQDQDCYNSRCVSPALSRCAGYGTCGHRGCTDHLPLIETSEGIK